MPYQNNHTEDPCPPAIEATTDYFEAVHQARKRRDLRWLAGALVDEPEESKTSATHYGVGRWHWLALGSPLE
jgi:hypothetical protein